MQSLEVISVNIWQIIISLCNLVILFLLLKKFLYKPVREMLAKRKALIDGVYADADKAKTDALAAKESYESKLSTAKDEADAIRAEAVADAGRRSDKLLAEAKDKADAIVRRAEEEAELERRKAADDVKREIADVSTALTEKLIGRELGDKDHRELIDSFIDSINSAEDIGGSK